MDLQTIYKEKEKQGYYTILEVEKSATKAELRKARRTLLSKYHPDKVDDKETKEISEKISALINSAFEALSDTEFREEYDKSNVMLPYMEKEITPTKKRKQKPRNLGTKRGISLTAISRLERKTLEEGATIVVRHLPHPGRRFDNLERTVTVKPNTKHDSFHVYTGLGEQMDNGENGDLIVLFQCSEELEGNQALKNLVTPNTIFVDTDKILPEGTFSIAKKGLLNKPIFVEKETAEEALIYIENVPSLSKSLLIKY